MILLAMWLVLIVLLLSAILAIAMIIDNFRLKDDDNDDHYTTW